MRKQSRRLSTMAASVSLGLGLVSAPIAYSQEGLDVCQDDLIAWTVLTCDTPIARQGRAQRGIAEPKHPEDPKILRERLRQRVHQRIESLKAKTGPSPDLYKDPGAQ
jgi:hypothetical protein